MMDGDCHCGRCNGDGPDESGKFELKSIHALGLTQCCFTCKYRENGPCTQHGVPHNDYDQVFVYTQYPYPPAWAVCPDWVLTDNKRRLSRMQQEVGRWRKDG